MPSEGATGTSPFVSGDVVFQPREFTAAITTWASVPYCTTDFSDYDNTATDHLITVHNPVIGIGDICRYMGIVDGSTWRIPTAKEWAELYGSDQENKGQSVKLGSGWIEGNYYPLSGRAMGLNRDNVIINGNGVDAQVTGADPNTIGAVFLPASGHRNLSVGAIAWIGTYGWYWSSTASTSDHGNYMSFNSISIVPQWSAYRTFAFTIRCIRE